MTWYALLPEILFLQCIFQCTIYWKACCYFLLHNENNRNDNIFSKTTWRKRLGEISVTTCTLITFPHSIAAPVWLHQDYTSREENNPSFLNTQAFAFFYCVLLIWLFQTPAKNHWFLLKHIHNSISPSRSLCGITN